MVQLATKRVSDNLDRRIWSLENHGKFIAKSLTRHLSAFSPLDKDLYIALWKSKCVKKVSILIWIMIFGLLNCALVMQRKLPSSCLSPLVCPLCKQKGEDLQHLLFECSYSANCWGKLFSIFAVVGSSENLLI